MASTLLQWNSAGAIYDTGCHQALLATAGNFESNSQFDVLEWTNGKTLLRTVAGEQRCHAYIESIGSCQRQLQPSVRVLFVKIERAEKASFGCRLEISSATTFHLLDRLQASPQLLNYLLGEPDYWAPGNSAGYDDSGKLRRIESFCQQPRWQKKVQDVPFSIYMSHDLLSRTTVYVVVCSERQTRLIETRNRLLTTLEHVKTTDAPDPFMLHYLIVHETLLDAKSVILSLRHQLYSSLELVDEYAKGSSRQRGKTELEDLTIQLHVVSQDIDAMTANAEMQSMIIHKLMAGHERYRSDTHPPSLTNTLAITTDALQYLADSVESQRRWLLSYKARKDIAMNLVYNLVTQQDAFTSTTIASAAKADGNSMKVIAALTMVFLPGTFLSSVFGMSMIKESVPWWLYVALTLPLTILVFVVWWTWKSCTQRNYRWITWRPLKCQRGVFVEMSNV